MSLRCIGIVLFLCLLICFHRDVPADVWKYDFERRMKRKELFIFATTCDAASSASPSAVGMRGRVSGSDGSSLWRRRQGLSVEEAKTFFESYVSGKASRSVEPEEHDNGFYIRRLMLPVGEFVPGWEEALSDSNRIYYNPNDLDGAFKGINWSGKTYVITQMRPNK